MDRLLKIAMVLLESNDPITTNSIASELGVSNKTIRNDLKKLQDFIEREGLKLTKKTGVGNYIEGPKKNKNILLQSLKKDLNYIEPYSPEGRQHHILKRLFMNNDNLTASKLADELFVCATTINKDLKQVEEIITPFNLKLNKQSNHILELIGKEKDYRDAIASLIFQTKEKYNEAELHNFEYKTRIDSATMNQLRILMNIDYSKLEEYLNNLEKKLYFKFSQEAYICLIIHIAISIKRIKNGKDVSLSTEILNDLKETKEFKCANEMSKEIGDYFGITIPKQEIGYITLHIIGSKIGEKDLENLDYPLEKVQEMELAVELANKIIDVASDALHTDLKDDTILLNGLILHLRPTINRLKYGLTLRNPILEEIKNNYPDIYGAAWITSNVFRKYLDVSVPESEIGYIALHLGASLERNRKKIKTLVVCHSGIGTSQLLSARLERCFKELDIVRIISSTDLTNEILEGAEIIISTVPIKINKPLLKISPLFTRDDIKKVERLIDFYQSSYIKKDKSKYIPKEVFIRSKRFINRNEAITDVCKSLEKRGYISESFKQSAIEREKLFSTEVGMGIAIPHGNPSEIQKSCVSVTVLKHPILWDREKVEFIFIICLTKKDMKFARQIFKNLSTEMDKPEFASGLRKGTNSAMNVLDSIISDL